MCVIRTVLLIWAMVILQVYFQRLDLLNSATGPLKDSGAFPDEVLGEVFEFEVSL